MNDEGCPDCTNVSSTVVSEAREYIQLLATFWYIGRFKHIAPRISGWDVTGME